MGDFMFKIILITILSLYLFIYFILCVKTEKPFKTMAFFAFVGAAALLILNLTGKFTGINIPINLYTFSAGAMLSLPGVILVLLLNINIV